MEIPSCADAHQQKVHKPIKAYKENLRITLYLSKYMDKLVFVFNKFYYSFIEDIANVVDKPLRDKLQGVLDAREKRSLTSMRYVERFAEQFKQSSLYEECAKSDNVFDVKGIDEVRVVKKITVKDIKDASKEKDSAQLKSYIYIFVMLAYLFSKVVAVDDSSSSEDDSDEEVASKDVVDESLACFKDIQNGKTTVPSEHVNDPIVCA